MTTQEFLDFCHEEFTKRGYQKSGRMYYLKGDGILSGLHLQKIRTYGDENAKYYIECDFFIGEFEEPYPPYYQSDLFRYIYVPDKSEGCLYGDRVVYEEECEIDCDLYTAEELRASFDRQFKVHILPAIMEGKLKLLEDMKEYEEFPPYIIAAAREKLLRTE